MIVSLPGTTVETRANGFPTGLTGTVGARLLGVDGSTVTARTTSPVETPAGSGSYADEIEAPNVVGRTVAVFDRGGTITPSTVAAELLEVTYDGRPAEFGEGDTVPILFAGFPTGITGTLGVRILDADDTEIVARTTEGITEILAGSGIYIATVTAPAPGAYTIFADTGTLGPSTTAAEQLTVTADPAPPPYEPTVAEVAARVPSRARADNGRIETFTDATQPTEAQVQSIIDSVVAKLNGRFGTPPLALVGAAKEVALLEAASRVELDFFADQIQAGRSPYNELKALRDEAFADYLTDRELLGPDDTPGTDDENLPAFWFPAPGLAPVHVPGGELPCGWWRGDLW